MIGSFLTRGLVMVFGYMYPAYECYKTVERNKPEVQQLRFWCQYWILVAALTVFERLGDTFASWVPFYCEAKLAFFIYLWFPKTKGTTYIYDSFFKPYVAKHENEIDRSLIELRTRAGDMVVIYSQRVVSFGQTRFTEILHYVATQSKSKSQPKEKKQPPQEEKQLEPKVTQAPPSSKKPQLITKESTSPKPTSSPRKQQQQQTEIKAAKQSIPQTKLTPPPSPSPSPATKAITVPELSRTKSEASQTVAVLPATTTQSISPSSKEILMEETLRITRGSLRKTRSTGTSR